MPERSKRIGGLGAPSSSRSRPASPAVEGIGRYLLDFFNPFSMPPGSAREGPSLRDVIVPPAANSPVRPPGLGEFLNPFSPPPSASPIGTNNPMGGPQLPNYWNVLPPGANRANPVPQLPEGWLPPDADWNPPPMTQAPRARYGYPVLRRKKPRHPKSRESGA